MQLEDLAELTESTVVFLSLSNSMKLEDLAEIKEITAVLLSLAK